MATSNYYSIYIERCIQLASTIVIKSEDIARTMNNALIAMYQDETLVDPFDQTSWKYYKNLAGEYHFTDTMMQVVSMDTLEVIDFTKENLAVHRATARAYQYGTRQYQELLTQYPTQGALIRGILYPIDIQAAIAARDHEILGGYPPSLVEVNEYSLIERLQAWVDGFKLQAFNPAYILTDNLYLASYFGMLYAYLFPAIVTIRWDLCKTNEANSFHVREYLASHGNLDQYYDQLSTSQALSLYRNIRYLERHPGRQESFSWLTDKLLTERQLPLAEYTMRHDLSAQPAQLDPEVFFQRTPLNLGYSYDSADRATIKQMLQKEADLARDNVKYQEDYEPVITTKTTNSLSNKLNTKILESAMVDYTDASPYSLSKALLNHWLWLSYKGYYTAVVNIENPRTGERIALPAYDAFCFMWYCFCASIGIILDEIPEVVGIHVQRVPTPTPDDLMEVVDKTKVDVSLAKWLLSYQPVIQQIMSTEAYYSTVKNIWRAENTQYRIVAYQEHMLVRGFAENMMHRIYADVLVPLSTPGDNYKAWLAARNLSVDGWTTDDFGVAYLNLVANATGQDLNTSQSIAALQRAMIGMMRQLSSYSVQFVSYINNGAIQPIDWSVIRLGDTPSHQYGVWQIPQLNVRLMNFHTRLKNHFKIPIYEPGTFEIDTRTHVRTHAEYEIPVTAHPATSPATVYHLYYELPVDVSYTPETTRTERGIIPVPGIDAYLDLSLEEQQNFKDVYGSLWSPGSAV